MPKIPDPPPRPVPPRSLEMQEEFKLLITASDAKQKALKVKEKLNEAKIKSSIESIITAINTQANFGLFECTYKFKHDNADFIRNVYSEIKPNLTDLGYKTKLVINDKDDDDYSCEVGYIKINWE